MSAAAVQVERWRVRYRGALDGPARRRLDAVARAVADGALERALQRAGVDPGAELCVRELRPPPIRLAPHRQTDVALADAWAQAIAEEVAARVAAGGGDVVLFGSRRQALVDMARCVAAGDLSRAWAWRALGLWPAEAPPDPAAVVVEQLARHGEAVVAVLVALAREGRLRALARRVDPAAWEAPAIAALVAAGAPSDVAQRAVRAPVGPVRGTLPVTVGDSLIAAVLPASPAVAALALAETEPAAVARLGATLPAAVTAAATLLPDGGPPSPRPEELLDGAEEPPELELASRLRASTHWGGLLFALHVVPALDLARRLPDVPLPATLHALALGLVPAEPHDPAALAFAGLAPGEVPPADERLEDAAARRVLAGAAAHVHAMLAERLGRPPAELELDALLRRRAEIVADPGWIEVHLDLDEVDVDVRRAGLDLDPGHLSFLGCVVRFAYA